MAFHEVDFPDAIDYASSGGPGHRTRIIETDSGAEQRVALWNGARHRFNAMENVKSHDDLSVLKDFAMARQGATYGFRYKDWSDYSTASNHHDSPSPTNHLIGTGDGSTTQFQLLKRYTSGGIQRVRNLAKVVANTTLVAFGSTEQSSGWSVNTATGIVTFTVAPLLGVEVFAGCQFMVPVRFGLELDDILSIKYDDHGHGSLGDVPLVEIINGLSTSDEFYYGGAATTDPMTANASIVEVNGRVQVFNPTSAGLRVNLPSPGTYPPGGPWFYLVNTNGSNALDVRDQNNTSIGTLAANSMGECVLGPSNQWYFR